MTIRAVEATVREERKRVKIILKMTITEQEFNYITEIADN